MKRLFTWFRLNPFGQFTLRVLLAFGSAGITIALSFLPYDTILQAIWIVVVSLFVGSRFLRQRLNETDEVRYRRLFRGRFEHLERTDPDALNTIFADNVRPPVLRWFESEHRFPVGRAKNIDALDSLSRSGDVPGQLIFRTGVELGKWLEATPEESRTVGTLEARLGNFIARHEHLLGEEVAEGIYLRYVKMGEQRPVGVHLFHAKSKCLFTVEDYAMVNRRSVALSLKASMFEHATAEQWQAFKSHVHREFPFFQPGKGGSGPQKPRVPLFVRSSLDTWKETEPTVRERLIRLMNTVPQRDQEKGNK